MRAEFESWLHRQWAKRGLFACTLSPLSLLYLFISQIKLKRMTPIRVGVPVVVVGNIYVGGTGKTPITIRIVEKLTQAGFHPGVISRGYKRLATTVQIVTESSCAGEIGDEPLLIAQLSHAPVAVGRDRVAAAKLLLEKHPEIDVIISDDGLQHRRLARDIELAVVGARGLGNGLVLPAGPLREPPARLDTVDAIILNASTDTLETRTPRYASSSQLGKAIQLKTGKAVTLNQLSKAIAKEKASVDAAAGIAMPDRFFGMLRGHELDVKGLRLGDHYDFHENPFKRINADYIFITGKDAVKCAQIDEIQSDERIWVVDLEMRIDPYLINTLVKRLKALAKNKKKD